MKAEEKKCILSSRRKRHPATITTRRREKGRREREGEEVEDKGERDMTNIFYCFAQSHIS